MAEVEVARLESLFPVVWADRGIQEVEPGTTIADLAPGFPLEGSWAAILDGKTVRPKDWHQHTIRDGSQVIFSPLPEDIVTAAGFFKTLLVNLIIGIGVNLVASKILGVTEPEQFEGPDNTTYTFNNLRQTADAGLPIKVVYGQHPVAGNILEMDLTGVTASSTGNQYGSTLDLTIGLCEGEISSVDKITINGNDLASYTGIAESYNNLGTNTQAALGSTDTTTTTTQNVNVDLPFPTLVTATGYMLRDCGGFSEGWTNGAAVSGSTITGSNGLTGTATVFGAGVNQDGSTDQCQIYNASAGSNLTDNHGQNCSTTAGTVTGVNSSGQSTSLTVKRSGGSFPFSTLEIQTVNSHAVSYTTTGDVDSVKLNILFPQGLYRSTNSGIATETAKLIYRYRDTSTPAENFSAFVEETITNDHVGAWIHTIEVPLATRGTYEFEVYDNLFHNPDDSDGYRMNLDSVVEVQDQVYTYPNLATLRLVINSDSSINGSALPNVIATVTGRKIQKWDGVSTASPNFVDASPYDNPAWVTYDLLTNSRYGLGNWVNTDRIDLQSFKDWADWCDEEVSDGAGGFEKRATFDGVFDGSTSAWEVALTVAATARGTLMVLGDVIKAKFERTRTPTQVFNMGNIIEGSWSQSYSSRLERPTRVEVQFLNADNNYQVDVVGVDDPDALAAQLPQKTLKLELPGVTRESQALREARFRLNIDKLSQVVSFNADIDAVACEPGDLVRVSHDLPSWGESGRISAATSSSVTLDRDITLDAGLTYQVLARHSSTDGTETATISSNAGSYTAGTAVSISGTWATTPAAGDLYSLGPFETYSKQVVISSITMTGELDRKLEGLVYTSEIHEDEIVTAASTFIEQPNPDQPPAAVTRLKAVELKTEQSQAAISWEYDNATPVGSALVWTRSSSGDPYTVRGSVAWPESQLVLPFNPGTSTQVTVTAVSPTGAHLQPTATTPITFTAAGLGNSPAAPESPALLQDDDLLEISWTVPPERVDHYEVRRGLDWVGSQELGSTVVPRLVTDQWCPTLSSGLTETYYIRAVSPTGRFGKVVTVTEANSLSSWSGGTTQVKDFSDSNWSGVTLSNMTIVAEGSARVVKNSSPGTLAKLQSDTYDTGALGSYRIGLIAHAQLESELWVDGGYAWQSAEGVARTWNGYAESGQWKTALAFQFRTRTSSSAAWSSWRPLTTRKVAQDFREIQVLIQFTPTDNSESITLQQMVLVLES